eukprot:56883-Pelagomonas_calceolata.AAC.1
MDLAKGGGGLSKNKHSSLGKIAWHTSEAHTDVGNDSLPLLIAVPSRCLCYECHVQFYLLVDGHLLAERKVTVPGSETVRAADIVTDSDHVDLQVRMCAVCRVPCAVCVALRRSLQSSKTRCVAS